MHIRRENCVRVSNTNHPFRNNSMVLGVSVAVCARWICQTSTHTHTRNVSSRILIHVAKRTVYLGTNTPKWKKLLTYNVMEWSTPAQHATRLAFWVSFFFHFFRLVEKKYFFSSLRISKQQQIMELVFLSAYSDASDINKFIGILPILHLLRSHRIEHFLDVRITKKATYFTHFRNIRHFRCHSLCHAHTYTRGNTQHVLSCRMRCVVHKSLWEQCVCAILILCRPISYCAELRTPCTVDRTWCVLMFQISFYGQGIFVHNLRVWLRLKTWIFLKREKM